MEDLMVTNHDAENVEDQDILESNADNTLSVKSVVNPDTPRRIAGKTKLARIVEGRGTRHVYANHLVPKRLHLVVLDPGRPRPLVEALQNV